MYVFGGIGADGELAPPVPLVTSVHGFAQKSCFDFLGNNAQVRGFNSINWASSRPAEAHPSRILTFGFSRFALAACRRSS